MFPMIVSKFQSFVFIYLVSNALKIAKLFTLPGVTMPLELLF